MACEPRLEVRSSAAARTAARPADALRCLDFRAMGSGMRVAVATGAPGRAMPERRAGARPGDRTDTDNDLMRVPAWFETWEQRLSRFRADSELALLNAAAGEPTAVSDTLWAVLRAALRAARWTDGLVAPTLLADVERAGYDRSFETMDPDAQSAAGEIASVGGRLACAAAERSTRSSGQASARTSTDASTATSQPRPDWRAIRMDPVGRVVTLPAGVRLDLGGIAKGWAADQAARRLTAVGPALVDAGGDIAVSGPQPGGRPWPIAVADPRLPGEHLAALWVGRGGVATSGTDYRRWRRGDRWLHHIIDPRTGEPAVTDVLGATVVARSAVEAEAAAKAALILGCRHGMAWIEARPHLAGLLVAQGGEVYASSRLGRYLGG